MSVSFSVGLDIAGTAPTGARFSDAVAATMRSENREFAGALAL
jgi:hypothetical protein